MKTYDPAKHGLKIAADRGVGWQVTKKIDGVQVVYTNGVPLSRAGKPLYNLPGMPDGTYECFLGTFKATIEAVRTINGQPIDGDDLYMLEPTLDPRLNFGWLSNYPDELTAVTNLFKLAQQGGYEGLVLRGPNGERLKVKGRETHDVIVRGIIPGTGKHSGRMGALLTDMGRVGTGFSNDEREWFHMYSLLIEAQHPAHCAVFDDGPLTNCPCDRSGFLIEVECMELTPDGKFRHPRFVRTRPDKRVEVRDDA